MQLWAKLFLIWLFFKAVWKDKFPTVSLQPEKQRKVPSEPLFSIRYAAEGSAASNLSVPLLPSLPPSPEVFPNYTWTHLKTLESLARKKLSPHEVTPSKKATGQRMSPPSDFGQPRAEGRLSPPSPPFTSCMPCAWKALLGCQRSRSVRMRYPAVCWQGCICKRKELVS